MGKIEDLAEVYGKHISTPWQKTISGAQRIIMVVYDKEAERALRARKLAFENATHQAGHSWFEVDVTKSFATWLAADEYREAYFESPEDLQLKIDAEFSGYVAEQIRSVLTLPGADENSVVAVFGVASLFGFVRTLHVMKQVEGEIRGRLVVFFPGLYENNNYRLLDARDGWNYMAVPISLHSLGGVA